MVIFTPSDKLRTWPAMRAMRATKRALIMMIIDEVV